jgi:hypothetical protein
MAAGCLSTPVTAYVPAFASPRSAVDAAVDAQRTLELAVRMGIATGEAELRGGDSFGVALNRAARVMAAGHGGQILLAASTAALLSGVDLEDLGRGGCAICQSQSGCSRFEPQAAHGVPAAAGAGLECGEPYAPGHQFHRARLRGRRGGSGAAGASPGDIDRGRRRGQDPAGGRGSRAIGR